MLNFITHIKKNVILNSANNIMKDITQNNKDITIQKETNIFNTIKNMFKEYFKIENNSKEVKHENEYSDKDFENKLKLGYNYPTYPNHNQGENLLLYIRYYLIGKNKNKRNPEYPQYITANDIHRETLIRQFLPIASNYYVDKNLYLYIKYYSKNKNNKKKIVLKILKKDMKIMNILLFHLQKILMSSSIIFINK